MKQVAAILLWLSLAALWICGGTALYAPVQEMPRGERPAGIYPTHEQAISMMQRVVSIYEVPSLVRVPASEQAQICVRLTPASLPAFGQSASGENSKCRINDGPFSPAYSKTVRSIDRYVYGLRKIII